MSLLRLTVIKAIKPHLPAIWVGGVTLLLGVGLLTPGPIGAVALAFGVALGIIPAIEMPKDD